MGVGTYGTLLFSDETHSNEKICHTIEREWLNNQSSISCIPDGVYWAEPYDSPTHGQCYIVHNEIMGVTKFNNDDGMRWGILFHKENWCHKLEGCIAPVTGFKVDTWTNGYLCGYSSAPALDKLMTLLNGRKAKLILKSQGCNL